MVTLTGYENLIPIHESANSLVYRARKADNNQPVILKFLNRDYPTTEQIRRYKQEYRLTSQLNYPGIVKAYSLEGWQRSYAIVLEDFGGFSLKKLLQDREKVSLEEFLFFAIAITESLQEIHAQNIIHKDINPANIVLNPETKELKIIDFGISTQLSRENPTLKNPNILEGTLAYISPEQTGRMNRSLDYRTDFYSLGVTFYELLTKQLPFATFDALELVHSHLAKTPIPPSEIDPSIPTIISEIVRKLMAKNAVDRYQSSWGLKADLETCLRQLKLTGNIELFPLANRDISDRFSIPQKLYGREKEIATLLAAFERVAETGKVELMMVAGYSGIGKSSLVLELYKPITARRGYFISGKFDQFQRNIPYSAIVSAFGGLIGQLLGENEAELEVWREKLLKALGSNGQIIIDVIPELELIIGKQPRVPALGGNEGQNRFNLVFANFLHAFCDKEHPLTLFIDDLQWADLATLQLMERMLVEGQTEYLLLLGAYRDNEVSASHPLAISLEKLRQERDAINQITLNPLPFEEIAYLIGDTFDCAPERASNFAKLVLQKTGGNPFFINEFLQVLYGEQLLHFNRQQRNWQWDLEAIEAREFTDNVVELMVRELQKLPLATQYILSIAACCGAEFDLKLMSFVGEKSPQEICQLLKIALDRDLVVPLSEADENLLIQSYKFAHDRIQQAAYNSIADEEKTAIHYQVGQSLLSKLSSRELEERLFDIVNHLNAAIALVTDPGERQHLSRLNLQAGQKAKTAIAYQAASNYHDNARALLDDKTWQSNYATHLEVYLASVETAFLCGDFEKMEDLAQVVLEEVQALIDGVKVYEIKLQALIAQNKLHEAIELGLDFLSLLDIPLPQQVTKKAIAAAFAENDALLETIAIEDVAYFERASDPYKEAAVRTITIVGLAMYVANPQLLMLAVARQVNLCLRYGNTSTSADAYATYGIFLCGEMGDIPKGYEFGKLAVEVLEILQSVEIKSLVYMLFNGFIKHWQAPCRETLADLQNAYYWGLEMGDFQNAALSAYCYCTHQFLCGVNLQDSLRDIDRYSSAVESLQQLGIGGWIDRFARLIRKLSEPSWEPLLLLSSVAAEVEALDADRLAGDRSQIFIFAFCKLLLAYLWEDGDGAIAYSKLAREHLDGITGMALVPCFYFYDALIQLGQARPETAPLSPEAAAVVQESRGKLQQLSEYSREKQHKYQLIEAEYHRVQGDRLSAIESYERAIAGAKKNEYIQDEALANELAAKFYLDWDREKVARVYMTDARYCYSRWGATAKVKHLEDKYPQLCGSPDTQTSASKSLDTRMTSESTDGAVLDLATVIKSTNAISSEIVLENLLATLMDILVENAGARRGILILPRGEGLFVEATKEADDRQVCLLQPLPLDKFAQLSLKIVRYVARTRETVVLGDAATEGNFTDDAYILQHRCKSVACTPLINQNKLQGIIYLENNLSAGAFTQERLALLRTLGAQGAISLENARLYKASKRFVPEQFLSFLEKKSIVDVELGDRVEREMTVLFSDIRDFTTMSEKMSPEENFAFINEYLGYMEPQIQKYGGFVDKYIGDAIMALFPNSTDDAVKGAIAMLEELKTYNRVREQRNLKPIRIGIGLHTGKLMLGTVGGFGRMDGTVIGDAVNLSSRVEGLTKTYGVSLLITHETWLCLNNPLEYDFRFIGQVKAKGKAKAVGLFEVFSADAPSLREAKIATKEKFEQAVLLYHRSSFPEAARLFDQCLEFCCLDRAARTYQIRCEGRNS
ncbi:MAG: AAA family ATPase [Cyanobacteriota bacterium]|nr:AAA family ATPase [Cyanobacteriota bacterium]